MRIFGHRHSGRHGQTRSRIRGEHCEDSNHARRGLPVRSPVPYQQGNMTAKAVILRFRRFLLRGNFIA